MAYGNNHNLLLAMILNPGMLSVQTVIRNINEKSDKNN
jgi:hypothetical protein